MNVGRYSSERRDRSGAWSSYFITTVGLTMIIRRWLFGFAVLRRGSTRYGKTFVTRLGKRSRVGPFKQLRQSSSTPAISRNRSVSLSGCRGRRIAKSHTSFATPTYRVFRGRSRRNLTEFVLRLSGKPGGFRELRLPLWQCSTCT